MKQFFLNDLIKDIRDNDFNAKDYQLAKALGFKNSNGKISNSTVNRWMLNKVMLRQDVFIDILEKLGYEIKIELSKKNT